MIIEISSDALIDLEEGFDFYQRQSQGLGAYFISCLTSDIEALNYFDGIHQVVNGYHRALSKRFPFSIYYLNQQRNSHSCGRARCSPRSSLDSAEIGLINHQGLWPWHPDV